MSLRSPRAVAGAPVVSRAALALAVVILAALVAAAAPAPAGAAGGKRTFAVEVSGRHVVEWTYRSDRELRECSTWSKGEGRQVTTFSTGRPERYTLQVTQVPGHGPVAVWLARDQRTHRFEITSHGRWQDHDPPVSCSPCGPNSEFGECQPASPGRDDAVACPRRERVGIISTAYLPPSEQERDDDLVPPYAVLRVATSVALDDAMPLPARPGGRAAHRGRAAAGRRRRAAPDPPGPRPVADARGVADAADGLRRARPHAQAARRRLPADRRARADRVRDDDGEGPRHAPALTSERCRSHGRMSFSAERIARVAGERLSV
jgi:hypothetical protein